ncbi:DUF5753 domain-containing protein [Pseudonocardia sp. HH130630-07]|uniref:DUF5753 domain-containing protein n=1 Tax=Pseudonocardia sp. HH130630-07 TaxID=1690815 RepID=UPI000814C669|nr:DUF5753 domain-containing protein [Pseudonocardia sp. HH130630-07]ANY08066.1 hypothetical protein AFB00_19195 [Pseudonocardia sp. HH130630-07]
MSENEGPDDAATRQRSFGERERASVHITTLGATIVPGLLQTESYLRAVVEAGGKVVGERLEEWVANRLWRQRVLTETGREFVQLVLPGALLWCAGSAAVMREQLAHLAVASRLPGLRLGVVPIGRPVDVFPMHNMDLYRRRDGTSEVVVGTLAGTAVLGGSEDVDRHAELLGKVERLAVFGSEAHAVIDEIGARYR